MIANLSRLLGRQHRVDRPVLGENAIRVFQPNDLVVLNQVEVIGL